MHRVCQPCAGQQPGHLRGRDLPVEGVIKTWSASRRERASRTHTCPWNRAQGDRAAAGDDQVGGIVLPVQIARDLFLPFAPTDGKARNAVSIPPAAGCRRRDSRATR